MTIIPLGTDLIIVSILSLDVSVFSKDSLRFFVRSITRFSRVKEYSFSFCSFFFKDSSVSIRDVMSSPELRVPMIFSFSSLRREL